MVFLPPIRSSGEEISVSYKIACFVLLLPAMSYRQGRSECSGHGNRRIRATVPSAVLTVTNTGTQQKRTMQTGESGTFEVTALEVGSYEVTAEAPGFRKTTVRGVVLEVDQRARIDIKLAWRSHPTGECTQGAIRSKRTTPPSAPSSTRQDPRVAHPGQPQSFRLALLAPGMSRGPASSVTTSGFGPGFGVAAIGQKVHNNAIMLDGAPLRTSIHGTVRMRPSVSD
jgi:hypothetical protein